MATVPRPEFDQSLLDALLSEDELGVVVRAHIHVEASLSEFIETLIPVPAELPNLRYQQRVELACALGLKTEHAPALKILGELRNAFAHKLNTTLSAQTVSRLYKALSETDKQAVHLAYKNTKTKVLTDKDPDFLKLRPKDQFVLMAVSLKAMLMVAVHEAKLHVDNP